MLQHVRLMLAAAAPSRATFESPEDEHSSVHAVVAFEKHCAGQ